MSVAIAIRRDKKDVGRRATIPLNAPVSANFPHAERGLRARDISDDNALWPASSIAIRKQLTRIFLSEPFERAERMKRFLAFVVEEALAGRRDQISEYSIALAVFDRGESFEPGLNPIVRNEARRLRHKLHEYYDGLSEGEHNIVIKIPKGGYVPVFQPSSISRALSESSTLRVAVTISGGQGRAQVWAKEYRLHAEEKLKIELEVSSARIREIEGAGTGA
jgi:hypothetical protein